MPQFEPEWFASQIFWLAIIFSAFYWFISRKAMPRIAAVLDERARRIEGDLQKAEQARRDAAEAMEAYEARIAEAKDEAQTLMRDAQERMSADQAKAMAEVESELNEQASAAEERIASARDAALADVRSIAIEVAGAMTSRLVGDVADESKIASAVDSHLKDGATGGEART